MHASDFSRTPIRLEAHQRQNDVPYLGFRHPGAPGLDWDTQFAALSAELPRLREHIAPHRPLEFSLQLGERAAAELRSSTRIAHFQPWLREQHLQVSALSSAEHGRSADWRHEDCFQHTLDLAHILATLLPTAGRGSLGVRALAPADPDPEQRRRDAGLCAARLVQIAAALGHIEEVSGRRITLAVTPAPAGLIEDAAGLARFFDEHLLPAAEHSTPRGLCASSTRELVYRHIGLCHDVCHSALLYRDPYPALERLRRAGIEVAMVRLGGALSLRLPATAAEREELVADLLCEDVRTSRRVVMERRRSGQLRRHAHLPGALQHLHEGAREWRIGTRVPLFWRGGGPLAPTTSELEATLTWLRDTGTGAALEIATEAWWMLPPSLRQDVGACREREHAWVRSALAAPAARAG